MPLFALQLDRTMALLTFASKPLKAARTTCKLKWLSTVTVNFLALLSNRSHLHATGTQAAAAPAMRFTITVRSFLLVLILLVLDP